ncbi:putative acetyl-hydrolase [Talaromyces proteolyticus]|uniref:Acetyl-hydrolase n=1 Tax=Talaromyces proteolyticus TaxID=1131652 RepID=A0AAD4KY74_9EURO|nr:putative acetyl-hydrolase [Talaromyces proteolyticus]KAH8701988.1 putative acetyl-hydrolase [Talaromyces proteolyticus]
MPEHWDPEKPLVARQPWKLFYSLYFILSTAVRVPIWAATYTIPWLRPVPSWSYKTALTVSLWRLAFRFLSNIRFRTPQPLEPGAEKDLFVELKPAADLKAYTGLLDNASVQPTSVGGFWLPSLECLSTISANNNGNSNIASKNWVILHFHGGGYVLISPRASTAQQGPRQLCEELPADGALCLSYRLSSNPDGSYPAPLQDAITAYNYLIHDKGISASRILVSGDSAGGHLAILLLRHLIAHPETGLPLPRALLLHSPWLDLTAKGTAVDYKPGSTQDYVCDPFLEWGATTFTPKGASRDTEFISPGLYPFKSPVPIWVSSGTVEKLYAVVAEWVAKMRDAGSTIELHDMKDMPHDTFAVSTEWDLETPAREAIRAAKSFLERVL